MWQVSAKSYPASIQGQKHDLDKGHKANKGAAKSNHRGKPKQE